MLKPMTIILIGAIIVVIGGIVGALGTYLHNRNSSQKTDRIEDGVKKNIGIGKTTNEDVKILQVQNNSLQSKVDELLKLTTSEVVNKPIEAIPLPARELKPAFILNPFFITNTVGPHQTVTISDLFSYRCFWYGSEVTFLVKVANEKSELSFSFGDNTTFPYTIVINSQGKTCLIQIINKTKTSFQVKTYSD